MTTMDENLSSYSTPAAIEQYAKPAELAECEAYLFSKYINSGQKVLDLGVGGGRTTPHLAPQARQYIGLDYSPVLIDVCREKFPSLEFVCGDATNLQRFATNSFDAVVFSYNGIDSIRSDEGRASCFREVARVLRPGGHFIFSSHNSRSLGFGANIRKYLLDRVESNNAVDLVSKARSLAVETGHTRLLSKLLRAINISIRFQLRKVSVADMYKGTGYYFDQSHGGLILFASTPKYVSAESKGAGLDVLEMVSNTYPIERPEYSRQWYYYALRKVADQS